MQPLVSVIIPAYGHADYIGEAVESALSQTYLNREIIVVNDGSPDGTFEALQPYIESGQIKYVEKKNGGQASARNRGLSLASGKYIAFLDDDDAWPAEKLAWQVDELERLPEASFVYGHVRGMESDVPFGYFSPPPSGKAYPFFVCGSWIRSPGQVLIRAASLRRVGQVDESIWGADDWDMYIRLSKIGTVIFSDKIALKYRIHCHNASWNIWRMYKNCRKVQTKHLGHLPFPGKAILWFKARMFIGRCIYCSGKPLLESRIAEGYVRGALCTWFILLWIRPWGLLQQNTYADLKRLLKLKGRS
jgi:glycosyltransferase involved in cell wall biosynthesis